MLENNNFVDLSSDEMNYIDGGFALTTVVLGLTVATWLKIGAGCAVLGGIGMFAKDVMMDIMENKISIYLIFALLFYLIPAGLNSLYNLGYMVGSWLSWQTKNIPDENNISSGIYYIV